MELRNLVAYFYGPPCTTELTTPDSCNCVQFGFCPTGSVSSSLKTEILTATRLTVCTAKLVSSATFLIRPAAVAMYSATMDDLAAFINVLWAAIGA